MGILLLNFIIYIMLKNINIFQVLNNYHNTYELCCVTQWSAHVTLLATFTLITTSWAQTMLNHPFGPQVSLFVSIFMLLYLLKKILIHFLVLWCELFLVIWHPPPHPIPPTMPPPLPPKPSMQPMQPTMTTPTWTTWFTTACKFAMSPLWPVQLHHSMGPNNVEPSFGPQVSLFLFIFMLLCLVKKLWLFLSSMIQTFFIVQCLPPHLIPPINPPPLPQKPSTQPTMTTPTWPTWLITTICKFQCFSFILQISLILF